MRITERDRVLLTFAAEHRVVLAPQLHALVGGAVRGRVTGLVREGLLRHRPVHEPPGRCYSILRAGLAAIDSDLPVPRFSPHDYRHDVGLAWLWIAARGGGLGPLGDVVSERRMRSVDAAQAHAARLHGAAMEPFGVRLGGVGPGGRERLHYPDLLLIGPDGRRIAVELELTPKARTRRERILAGYGADRRLDGVLYLVDRRSVGQAIGRSAARLGLGDRVRVQAVRWGHAGATRPGGRAMERTSGRAHVGGVEAGR